MAPMWLYAVALHRRPNEVGRASASEAGLVGALEADYATCHGDSWPLTEAAKRPLAVLSRTEKW